MIPIHVETLSSQVRTSAAKLGIEKFDIYGATVDETSVQVDQGEPKQVKASTRSSVIVRAWNADQTMGVTSTNDLTAVGLELALQTAHEASFFGVKDHVPDFSPVAQAPLAEHQEERLDPVPAAELVEQLIKAEQTLLTTHPAIKQVPYNGLAQREVDRFYFNSAGALRHEARSGASIYLFCRTEQEGRKPRSGGAIRIGTGVAKLDVEGCLEEAAEKTISHLNYEKIKSGKYTVVFSPEAFLSLLGAFTNLFNAQNILDKQSLSTPESLGTQIASPLLSVVDDPLHPERVSADTFDGEGTPTARLHLIENGILTHFMHSAGTAKRMGAQPTGHANIGAKVTVSPHFFHVLPGSSPDETYRFEDVEDVIWIDDLHALHAGVKALQGSFSLPFDGWLLQKGQKTSIESATVAGDFLKLLDSIVYVEPEAEVTPGGVCPRIWVKDLSITGD